MREAKTISEAWDMIFGGVIFFLKYHTMKTVVVLLLICGSNIYVILDYFRSDMIKIEPLKPLSSNFIFPKTYAGGENPIIIDGVYYGENDINYLLYKIKNSNEIIIYNKWLKSGFRYEIPALENFKQMKKK